MNVAVWILAGAVVGWLAYAVVGYNATRGLKVSVAIGAFGGFVGGQVVAPMLVTAAAAPPGISKSALVMAVVIAATLLFLCNVAHKRWDL